MKYCAPNTFAFLINIRTFFLIMTDVQLEASWKAHLNSEFEKPYFPKLAEFVRSEYKQFQIFPPGRLIFHAFDSCPFHQVKVVILGQDPYINPGQAMGLSFSVPDGIPKPPSLLNIFKEIRRQTGKEIPLSGNLSAWADQGVLLLNTVLTVRAGLSNSHAGKGWEQFTDAAISVLSSRRERLVFLLWGSHARKKAGLIDVSKHLILESAHPSPMSADRGFFGNGHFLKTNEFLISKDQSPINW